LPLDRTVRLRHPGLVLPDELRKDRPLRCEVRRHETAEQRDDGEQRAEAERALIQLWMEKGWVATLRKVVEEDPDWIAVYLEMSRKERTDPDLGRLHRTQAEELAPALIEHVREEQARGDLRGDVPAEKIAGFVSIVANGIAVQLGSGEPIRDVDTLVAFVRSAVGPPTT